MSVVIDGTTGVTAAAFDGAVDAADLTGNVAAARITTALNATGSAPIYACRAWVNFNGTGTVAIRASGNVSSITDNGTGDYTVNFATAMPDANYSFVGGGVVSTTSASANQAIVSGRSGFAPSASSLRLVTSFGRSGAFDVTDFDIVNVAIFR
jgi:hypothetical protein